VFFCPPAKIGLFFKVDVPFTRHDQPGHKLIIENFVNAFLTGETLIAPAVEGINFVTLANAIMLSSFLRQSVDLPLDEETYAEKLQSLIQNSWFQKTDRC
jgi:hypothetical protein